MCCCCFESQRRAFSRCFAHSAHKACCRRVLDAQWAECLRLPCVTNRFTRANTRATRLQQELATAGVVVLVVGLVAYGIKKFLDSSNTTTTTRRHKKKTKIYKPAVTADPATKDAYANVTSVTTAPAM